MNKLIDIILLKFQEYIFIQFSNFLEVRLLDLYGVIFYLVKSFLFVCVFNLRLLDVRWVYCVQYRGFMLECDI